MYLNCKLLGKFVNTTRWQCIDPRTLPSPPYSYRSPLDSSGFQWTAVDSYRSFFGRYTGKIGGPIGLFSHSICPNSGNFRWNPLELGSGIQWTPIGLTILFNLSA